MRSIVSKSYSVGYTLFMRMEIRNPKLEIGNGKKIWSSSTLQEVKKLDPDFVLSLDP